MRTLITLSFLVYTSFISFSQTLVWANTYGSTDFDKVSDIISDEFGNIYSIGRFEGTVDFDPGTAIELKTSAGLQDIYIQKLDGDGNFVWVKTFGGSGNDLGKNISLDEMGNIITLGTFEETCDFDPGIGIMNLSSNGKEDAFILKLNSLGEFLWAKSIGGLDSEDVHNLITDKSRNIYLTGVFYGTVDFDPGPAEKYKTATGSYIDFFVEKMDTDGNFIWVNQNGGDMHDGAMALELDKEGNLLVGGIFSVSMDADPGPDTHMIYAVESSQMFLQRVTSDGNFIDIFTLPYKTECTGITIDSLENILLLGRFSSTCDFDPGQGTYNITSNGGNDVYVLKLTKDFDFVWAVSFGGNSSDIPNDIQVDDNGSVYVVGTFRGNDVDFDPDPVKNHNLTCGSLDILFWKLTSEGKFCMAMNVGSVNNIDDGSALVVTPEKNVVIGGYYTETADFDPSNGINNHSAAGAVDAFIFKWATCSTPTYNSISETACGIYTSPSSKYVYTSSGTYNDTIANSIGCDSVITINLTVIENTYDNLTVSTCSSYTAPSDAIYTATGIYKDTIPNTAGCDSIISIDLTLLNSSSSMTEFSCGSYTSPSGKMYSVSDVYTDTVMNTSGCDSIITIDLTIGELNKTLNYQNNTLSSGQNGVTYQWLNCNQNMSIIPGSTMQSYSPLANGSFAVEMKKGGCTDTSECFIVDDLGLESLKKETFLIYPNPVDDMVTIEVNEDYYGGILRLFDNTGRVFGETKITMGKLKLSFNHMAPGVYYVEITSTENSVLIKKISKK
jgi:hypothetical protein